MYSLLNYNFCAWVNVAPKLAESHYRAHFLERVGKHPSCRDIWPLLGGIADMLAV